MFILTHNVHFHTKIANYLVHRYDIASYYLLKKADNISKITHCIQPNQKVAGEMENFNPVPSEYTALWNEYKVASTPKVLRSLIWQILDYYFVKLIGKNGDELRECVLVEKRENFVEKLPNGTEDNSKHIMASKLLSYMGTTEQVNDEMYYADDITDIAGYHDAFAIIFKAMEQNQHYDMMMEV